jgi:hypothetical protein
MTTLPMLHMGKNKQEHNAAALPPPAVLDYR